MHQVTMLHTMHQTTQQQMLHEMQHRDDRLLEAPRQPAAAPVVPASRATPQRRGADLKASGQAFDSTRHVLGRLCPRAHEYQGTGQSLQRLPSHVCFACDAAHTRERRKAKRGGAQ